MNDWLYNAGIVGFVNILEHAGDIVSKEKQTVEVNAEVLEGFEEKYFRYFIDTYEKTLSWHKIVSFAPFVRKHINEDLENFDETSLDTLNAYIGTKGKSGSIKYYLNSNSYKKAYEIIDKEGRICKKEEAITQVKHKKKETIADKKEEILQELKKLDKLLQIIEEEKARKYLGAKNVIYNIINLGMGGVSFLNRNTKELDMYVDYKNYYLAEPLQYMESEEAVKGKYQCFTCDNKTKTLNHDLNFLIQTGFDTGKKTSHVWNYQNDVAICPICKLIYSCVPAGITYVYGEGIFINHNHEIDSLLRINRNIMDKLVKDNSTTYRSTYRAMITAMMAYESTKNLYEFSDVQVVKLDNIKGTPKYRFTILPKESMAIMSKAKTELESLSKASYKEVDNYIRLYDEVTKALLNREGLYHLLNTLLVMKNGEKSNLFYTIGHIRAIQYIQYGMEKGEKDMVEIKKELKTYSAAGYGLRRSYIEKGAQNKLNGIAYKLLNALKTNNTDSFMDTLLNCYLYVNKEVPTFMIQCLDDEEAYKTIGYAFVTGLIDGEKKRQNESEEK